MRTKRKSKPIKCLLTAFFLKKGLKRFIKVYEVFDPKPNFRENRIRLLSLWRSEKRHQSQRKGQRALSNFKLGSAECVDTNVSIYVAKRWFPNTKRVYTLN